MNPLIWIVVAAAVIGVFLIVLLINIYNRLVQLRNRFENSYSQIDVQLKRRYDLIPNLVETAKAYLKHERETLEAVIAARNQAVSANNKAAESPSDPAAIQAMIGAESALGGSIGRLFALMENYPDLKGNENMLSVQEELSSTENRIGFARQAYNDSVMSYNARRESFPDILLAGIYGFQEAVYWLIEDATERETPQVDF
jgi:LemA protein